jgi:hypothetical protein
MQFKTYKLFSTQTKLFIEYFWVIADLRKQIANLQIKGKGTRVVSYNHWDVERILMGAGMWLSSRALV